MSSTLSSEDLRRLDTLFERASELPPEEHAEFIERECGSHVALREELEHLLAGLASDDVLGRLQGEEPTLAGTDVGPYRLLERIGKGGMGEVYLAEQREPIVRRVALKIIKPGMDSAEVVARFRAERQALARMAHPNVAQVHGAGATESGRPYFVMEYVEGEPIDAYCDRRKLSTRARLAILLDVCEGVQHAHQKGLVHRDLKPSNLLVAEHDGRALPKIIDFGVARPTTGRLAEDSLHTRLGQIVGTLEYMSPEQADPTGTDVDTRSDVYSLGVVLYQLVSGLLPFEHASMADLPFSELLRTLREKDPATPSTRLKRLTETATVIAPLHGTHPRALVRQLAGELDWICLRALEKDPARRYASASELAADLRRYLANEPVLAGRPGTLYRTRKFVRRNRVAVTAGVLIAGAALAGIAGVVSGRLEAATSARVADALRPQADAHALRQLEQEADELWPAHPDRIPALRAWEERAQGLLGSADADRARLSQYRAELEELRTRARAWSQEEREDDRRTHPRAEELASMQAELRNWMDQLERLPEDESLQEEAEKRLAVLEPGIALLEPEVGRRRTWSFDSDADAARHEVLSGLVAGLEALCAPGTGLLTPDGISPEHGWSVPRRLSFAETIAERSVLGADAAARWNEAIDSIADPDECPRYQGLRITPQIGLLPVGKDEASGLWEFAHLQTGAPAERGPDGRLRPTDDTGLVLVLLPQGRFLMGAQAQDPSGDNYDPWSNPAFREAWRSGSEGRWVFEARPVEVPAFFLSKFEMTQAQWELCTGANPSLFQMRLIEPAPLNPVNQVTWNECDTTLHRLGLCLPSEEQWEYAVRAGTTTPWWTGESKKDLQGMANLGADVCPECGVPMSVMERSRLGRPPDEEYEPDGVRTVTRVGSFVANPFGLHDMLGNVSEWCSNHPYYYGTTPGTGPETLKMHAVRGGNAGTPPIHARSAARPKQVRVGGDSPTLGLRPARVLAP